MRKADKNVLPEFYQNNPAIQYTHGSHFPAGIALTFLNGFRAEFWNIPLKSTARVLCYSKSQWVLIGWKGSRGLMTSKCTFEKLASDPYSPFNVGHGLHSYLSDPGNFNSFKVLLTTGVQGLNCPLPPQYLRIKI